MFATHGDTVIDVGNPGKNLNVEKLIRLVLGLETSNILSRRPEVVMLGHWHAPFWCRIPSGERNSHLIVNGCASGLSPYANSIGFFSGSPVQTFFPVTSKSPIETLKMVDLGLADKDERYEQIVPVPKPIGVPLTPREQTPDFFALVDRVDQLSKDA